MNKSAFEALPPAFRVGDQALLSEAITAAYDDTIDEWRGKIEGYDQTLLDPMSIDARLLDWRASLTPWRTIWNADWAESTKRALLANTAYIFQNRYSPDLLPKLFGWFGLLATLEPRSGLILGVTALPAVLGTGLDAYQIRVPSYYTPGTIERGLTDFIVSEFGSPVAIDIVYSA